MSKKKKSHGNRVLACNALENLGELLELKAKLNPRCINLNTLHKGKRRCSIGLNVTCPPQGSVNFICPIGAYTPTV